MTSDPASTVFVDATQAVSVSGRDDLATLQNIFQDSNTPADSLGGPTDPRGQVIADLKMKRSRLLQDDAYCDLDIDRKFGQAPFPDRDGNYSAPVVAGDCGFCYGKCNGR